MADMESFELILAEGVVVKSVRESLAGPDLATTTDDEIVLAARRACQLMATGTTVREVAIDTAPYLARASSVDSLAVVMGSAVAMCPEHKGYNDTHDFG